ncbi:DUF4333 domain-containing protein [Kovacikia minuta CCNUW1]|uniref:DUF4333 domain-containing protein n=1 Tax=Kovacikia minuta TaxID=2931930 RepID=UPI001CCF3D64|nr:DUF4333 domain-containing protein [Kovacikia minuta]UBF24137.1 DUF4333 domain-containing protein [Kovacikia minuta CCNUW1]
MRQSRSIMAFIAVKASRQLIGKNWVGVLLPVYLASLLVGCFNRSQPAADVPSPNTPTPTNPVSSPSPSPTGSAIASPTATPPTPSPTSSESPSGVAKELEARLNKAVTVAIETPLQSLTCPAGVEIKVGNRFDCNAVSEGQAFAIAVEITSTTGPQFQWNTKGLLVLSKLEQFIQQQIRDKKGGSVTADCGGGIRVANPGDTFECKVSDPQGQSRAAKITVKDEQGTVDVALI